MPVTDRYQRLPLSAILIDREARQRKKVEIEALQKSIQYIVPSTGKPRGVLNPVLVETIPGSEQVKLIAGECRVEASRVSGLLDIPVRFADEISPVERELMELEENVHRTDLEWQDRVSAVARIHALHGQDDPDWTMGETAEACGLNISTISMYLRVHGELSENERVQKAGTVREAYNALGRRDARAAGDALEELMEMVGELGEGGGETDGREGRGTDKNVPDDGVPGTLPPAVPHPYTPPTPLPKPVGPPPADSTILHTSFLNWAPQYTGQKFNFIHCDFPYGIEVFSGPQARGAESTVYGDSKDLYVSLIECLCMNLDRLMTHSGHLMFWYSDKHRELTLDLFRQFAPSLDFRVYQLIWVKSSNAGIAADPKYGPRHVYETALLASRGKRQIVKVVGDAYVAPSNRDLHPSTKPEPMLRHFLSMLVDEHTSMLDPTCGSGASLRAAESLGARSVLGLEIDEQYVKPARQALTMARRLRDGSRAVKELV